MKTIFRTFFVLPALILMVSAHTASAITLSERLSGRILLDVQNHGEAWYVYPKDHRRYYLGRPQDAYSVMRALSLGISNTNLAKIPSDTDTFAGDGLLRQRLSGQILLQVEAHGEAWYVSPVNLKRYYLGRPDDAFRIMRQLGLGITSSDLATIPVGQTALGTAASTFQTYVLATERGLFAIDAITLSRSAYEMVTATADSSDCKNNCAAKSLEAFVKENGADIGIHGTYFCPPEYPECANATNSFLWPVYNSSADVMINQKSLEVHQGPLMAYGADGRYEYVNRAKEFGSSVVDFEFRTGTQLVGAVANYPSLMEKAIVVVQSEARLDENMKNVKAVRGGIGFNGNSVFLVVARSATVVDLAYIFKALGATDAMNLDGGGSAALYRDGSYVFGPGRLLPNAIVFRKK